MEKPAPTSKSPSSANFLRRLTRHFTRSKTSARAPASVARRPSSRRSAVPRSSAVKALIPASTTVPNIAQPSQVPSSPISPRERSKSPSSAPRVSAERPPPSPSRTSLSSFRYPPLPPSPSVATSNQDLTLLSQEKSKDEIPTSVPFPPTGGKSSESEHSRGTPTLVSSDSQSSTGLPLSSPITPAPSPTPDSFTGRRGRQDLRHPKKEPKGLLDVPGTDDALDDDAWTDDELSRSRVDSLPLITEEPKGLPEEERKPLSVVVPPSTPCGIDVTSSPTEDKFPPSATLERVEEGDEGNYTRSPMTGGIEFVIPAQPACTSPSKSSGPIPRSRTMSTGRTGTRRSKTFSRLFGFGGGKKDGLTPSRSATSLHAESPEVRSSVERLRHGLSMSRASRLDVDASNLPTRAPTVRQMTNTDIDSQMENLRSRGPSVKPEGDATAPADDETARLTEAAFF